MRKIENLFKEIEERAITQELFEKKIKKYENELRFEFKKKIKNSNNPDTYIRMAIDTLEKIIMARTQSYDTTTDEIEQFKYFWSHFNSNLAFEYCVPKSIPEDNFIDFIAKALAQKTVLDELKTQVTEEELPTDTTTDKLTAKQKVLLIHYLEKFKIINLNTLHQDKTKQAGFLSPLLGRTYDSVKKALYKIPVEKYESQYFKKENLQAILPILKILERPDITAEIERKLDELKSD